MFFQWMMCAGIWSVGVLVAIGMDHLYDGAAPHAPFLPLATVGGMSWATGGCPWRHVLA